MAARLTRKEFQRLLDRDGSCYHCGRIDDTLIPQHRKGRGMGGSKERNRASNVVVFCSWANGELEGNATFAARARELGWALRSGQDSATTPIRDATGTWWLLDDGFQRKITIR